MNSLPYELSAPSTAWKMLLWLLIAQVMVSFVGRSLAPLIILIEEDFFLSNTQIGMIPAAFFLGQSLIAIPAGLLVDRSGSKKQLFNTVLLLGISFILLALSTHFYVLLLVVVMGGGAYAAMHPITNRGILYWFPQKSRGTAMGIKQMGITVGSALAALILLPVANEIGWRPALIVSCLVLVAVGFFASYLYRDSPTTKVIERMIFSKTAFFEDLSRILKNRRIVILSISAMGLQGAQLCLTTYIVLFAYGSLEMTLVLAGLLLVIAEIGGSIGRVAWGSLSDIFFNEKRMIVMFLVTILSGVCALLISGMTAETPTVAVMSVVLLFGFCISGYNGAWMTIIVEAVQKEQSGLATGVTITISSWGVIIIPPLFGYFVDTFESFSIGWIFLAVLMAVVTVTLKFATANPRLKSEF